MRAAAISTSWSRQRLYRSLRDVDRPRIRDSRSCGRLRTASGRRRRLSRTKPPRARRRASIGAASMRLQPRSIAQRLDRLGRGPDRAPRTPRSRCRPRPTATSPERPSARRRQAERRRPGRRSRASGQVDQEQAGSTHSALSIASSSASSCLTSCRRRRQLGVERARRPGLHRERHEHDDPAVHVGVVGAGRWGSRPQGVDAAGASSSVNRNGSGSSVVRGDTGECDRKYVTRPRRARPGRSVEHVVPGRRIEVMPRNPPQPPWTSAIVPQPSTTSTRGRSSPTPWPDPRLIDRQLQRVLEKL